MSERRTWSEADLPNLSWHDNHVHGLQIVEGEHGSGELILDIDHIVEWLRPCETTFTFRVAPATLAFHAIMDLRVNIDYGAVTAGIVPPSIEEITREEVVRPDGFTSYRWTIKLNWPAGSITFAGGGFTQVLRAEPEVRDHQCLEPAERG